MNTSVLLIDDLHSVVIGLSEGDQGSKEFGRCTPKQGVDDFWERFTVCLRDVEGRDTFESGQADRGALATIGVVLLDAPGAGTKDIYGALALADRPAEGRPPSIETCATSGSGLLGQDEQYIVRGVVMKTRNRLQECHPRLGSREIDDQLFELGE